MTRLEAINEMLEWIGQSPVTALDTGGTSEEAEAESKLDRTTEDVLRGGWWFNEEYENGFGVPSVKIGVSGGSGTFSYGEVVTESVTGATGTFDYLESGFIYLHPTSGTFTGGQTLTGGTSGATRTGGAYSAITEAKIAWPPSAFTIQRWPPESRKFDLRAGFFYNLEDHTYTWTVGSGITSSFVIFRRDFDDIPESVQNYITKRAAYSFLRYKFPGRTEGLTDRQGEVLKSKVEAKQEDSDKRDVCVHDTKRGRELLGDRYSYYRPSA